MYAHTHTHTHAHAHTCAEACWEYSLARVRTHKTHALKKAVTVEGLRTCMAMTGPVTLLTIMMRPLGELRSRSNRDLVTRKAVSRFRANPRRHMQWVMWGMSVASSVSAGLEMLVIPALFTKISRQAICDANCSTVASFDKSPTNPRAPISLARSWIRSVVEHMMTSAPRFCVCVCVISLE